MRVEGEIREVELGGHMGFKSIDLCACAHDVIEINRYLFEKSIWMTKHAKEVYMIIKKIHGVSRANNK